MHSDRKHNIFLEKILYTFLILLVYIVGKSLPLYGIEVSAYLNKGLVAEDLMVQTISGDLHQCSLLALGVAPHMIASIIVQIISACRNTESRSRISPKKMNQLSLILTFGIAIVQAILQVRELQFKEADNFLFFAKGIAVIEMLTGVMIILWLSTRNKQYGIGGQSILILVNILDGIIATMDKQKMEDIAIPLLVSVVVIGVMLFMENTEKRIPVQRISIHNIYADKNYLAIKLNPIGVMPAMFSTAFFLIPQLILAGLQWIFPESVKVLWWYENMSLSKPLGIAVYILILYCLTVGFSIVFVNPKDMTEQFLKSGDSLLDIHAGKDTRRYLIGVISRISCFSATVMGICLGTPLILQLIGEIDSILITLPSSMMMLTGIMCNLYREATAVRNLESYKPFI